MDIDCDWCLTCEKHIENGSPYCSIECQERAAPSHQPYWCQPSAQSSNDDDELDADIIYHNIDEPSVSRWTGNDMAGIEAWAAQIPYGAPAGDSCSPASSSSYSSPAFQQQRGTPHRSSPPSLLTSNCLRRTLPPSLSMATPPHVRPPPSNPMQTPKRQSSFSTTPTGNASMGQTSLRSAATGSSLVATPYSSQPVPILQKQSLLDGMYSHVRSWVSPAPIHQQQQQQIQVQQKPHRTHPSQLISHAPSPAAPVFPVRVVSSPRSSCAISEKSAVCWMASTVVLKQQDKPVKPQRGRKLLGAELADHPSFRARGRKASRTAA